MTKLRFSLRRIGTLWYVLHDHNIRRRYLANDDMVMLWFAYREALQSPPVEVIDEVEDSIPADLWSDPEAV